MYGRGHEQGTRKQRKPATPWWAEAEEAAIQAVEQEWAARAPALAQEERKGGNYETAISSTTVLV